MNNNDSILDSDDDGIYDDWEINGYTVEKGLIVKWDDAKHKDKGFIKYQSDPYKKSTTGDPYSDADKVLGKVDGGILPEAQHPLVAAYPEIGVNMEKLVLSKNQNISKEIGETTTHENSQTVAVSTTNSHTESNSISVSETAEASLTDMGVSVTASYSHEWSTTVSTDNSQSTTTGKSEGKSWTSTLGINSAEAAFLNGNVRYINVGTAPIYNAKPTLNFVIGLGKDAQTISTVVAKSNTVADVLLPGTSYPDKSQSPIAFSANDDFNSQPIKLNYDQVEKLNQGEKLQIQTTQTSGLYKTYDMNDKVVVNETQNWEYILADIYSRTAAITVSLKDGTTMKRRVSARKIQNYANQTQPELTLKEGLTIAFPSIKIDYEKQEIAYQTQEFDTMKIIIDQATQDNIVAQLKSGSIQNIFDAKLMQGMNILIYQENYRDIFQHLQILLRDFNEQNRISLQFEDSQKKWQDILQLLMDNIKVHFTPQDFAKIKNWTITNATKRVYDGVIQDGYAHQYVTFEVGKLKSGQINIFFKNINADAALLENFRIRFEKYFQNWTEEAKKRLLSSIRDKQSKNRRLIIAVIAGGIFANVESPIIYRLAAMDLESLPWWK